jgi:hypothetical protein
MELWRGGEGISHSPQALVNVQLGRTVLPTTFENKLVQYCITMDQRFCGLRRQDIKRMAFQLALRKDLKHPSNQEKSAAGNNGFDPF